MSTTTDVCVLDEEGIVLRLGGVVEATDRISWLPPDTQGWVPLHCYLVKLGEFESRERAVLIDASFPVIEDAVVGQLSQVLANDTELTMVLTRQAEYESIGNAAAILQRFTVTEAWGNSALEESLYFSPRHSPISQHERGPWWPHGDDVAIQSFGGSAGLEIGVHRFEWVNAPLRLLATVWVYHANSGTLFSSDAFAVGCLGAPDASPIIEEVMWDREVLRSFLLAKYRWVEVADITRIAANIDELVQRVEITCVAPTHGWIIRGAAAKQFLVDYRDILGQYCGG